MVEEEDMPTVPEFSNVAEGRPAEQSTTWGPNKASNAVDGIINKWFSGKSCMSTSRRNGNWWTVELEKEETVTSVVIHNRLDGCCYRKIDGAKVWLEDASGERELCDTISYHVATPIIVVPCGGKASKVRITQENDVLTMCEVEVLVVEEPVEPTEEDGEEEGGDDEEEGGDEDEEGGDEEEEGGDDEEEDGDDEE